MNSDGEVEVVILVGLQASGKTSFYMQRFEVIARKGSRSGESSALP